jgi:hypothetical protein
MRPVRDSDRQNRRPGQYGLHGVPPAFLASIAPEQGAFQLNGIP